MRFRSPLARTLYYVGPLLLWMFVIYSLSTDAGAAQNTTPVMHSILRRLLPGLADRLGPVLVDRIDWNIRKTAHIVEYAILALLAYRAVSFGNPAFRHRNVVLPFLIGALYAVSDEYHQSLTALRGASAADVMFDVIGVTWGLLLCLWRTAARQAREEAAPAVAAQ